MPFKVKYHSRDADGDFTAVIDGPCGCEPHVGDVMHFAIIDSRECHVGLQVKSRTWKGGCLSVWAGSLFATPYGRQTLMDAGFKIEPI